MNIEISNLIINIIPMLITLALLIVMVIIIWRAIEGITKGAVKLLLGLVSIVLLLMLTFGIYIGAFWTCDPSDLNFKLSTNDHTFKIGPTLFSITGTYEDTDGGYIITPTFGLPFGILPSCFIKKIDRTHVNLVYLSRNPYGLKFVDKDSLIHTNQIHIVQHGGVITFVPDKG